MAYTTSLSCVLFFHVPGHYLFICFFVRAASFFNENFNGKAKIYQVYFLSWRKSTSCYFQLLWSKCAPAADFIFLSVVLLKVASTASARTS